jgi:hypothetical protein
MKNWSHKNSFVIRDTKMRAGSGGIDTNFSMFSKITLKNQSLPKYLAQFAGNMAGFDTFGFRGSRMKFFCTLRMKSAFGLSFDCPHPEN